MRQSRIRHARREFKRAYPQIAEAVERASLQRQRNTLRIVAVRNLLLVLAAAGVFALQCGLGR